MEDIQKDLQNLKDDAAEFLKENSTAVVATSFKDSPRVSTVYFFTDNDFNFYFATKRKTSKYINLELNPKAAFVVGVGPEHISVEGYGEVELVVNEVERQRLLDLLIGKQNIKGVKVWPIENLKNFKDNYKVIFKITPVELFYFNLDSEKHPQTQSDKIVKLI